MDSDFNIYNSYSYDGMIANFNLGESYSLPFNLTFGSREANSFLSGSDQSNIDEIEVYYINNRKFILFQYNHSL